MLFVRLMFKSGLYSKNIFLSWFLRLLIKSGSYSRASIIGAGTVYVVVNVICEASITVIEFCKSLMAISQYNFQINIFE